MKKISLQNLKHTLKDIHTNTESRKFCFVLGAGASFKSGIPTGGQLARIWFDEIRERHSQEEFLLWTSEAKISITDLAAHYGSIYRKRFESDKASGYEFLVQAMKTAKPTFGHFVLAQILTKATGNCVLTTNFDSLIESSIYQYTDKTPLVCGHESLSGYARPSNIHPLIIKIHRDLLLSPKSDLDEINKLDEVWEEPLDNMFSSHIPIVIGYGGNDGSLMKYFEQMNKPSNFFWCGHKETTPSERVKELIKKMDGFYIEIDGFDEMMKELLWVFDKIKPVDEELETVTKSRIEAMNKQLEDMNVTIANVQNEKGKKLSAYEYSEIADKEPDYEKRKTIYLEALAKFPKTAWLWNAFTYFLHFEKKDFANLEEYYLKTLAIEPDDANNNGNYAIFLNDIRKDYDTAEKYYLKALAIAPDNAINNGNYAVFLNDLRKDYDTAEKHYLKALATDPDNAINNENYAVFLKGIRKDYDTAEKYYLKALAIAPDDAINNGNYAVFLNDLRKDFDTAEKYYLKSLAIEPDNAIYNGNYAIFLKDIRKDYDTAEKYYLIALAIAPDNAITNGNYAVFLNDIRKDYNAAEKHYLKALAIEPEHANNNGNYAHFLLALNRKNEATPFLKNAFILNNNKQNDLLIELWFYKYAHYLESLEESEKAIEDLLTAGIRSIGWNFEQNIEVAIKSGHPNPEKLKELAERITKD